MAEDVRKLEPPIRRVVAGHDADGKAVILQDGPAANTNWLPNGNVSTHIWASDETPAEVWTDEDFGARKPERQPPHRGMRFSVLDIPAGGPGSMHRTDTLDYIVCLSGSIEMHMPDGSVTVLRQGDAMVQQGTDHQWVNSGRETCRLAIVLLDALRAPEARKPWTAQPKPAGSGPLPQPPIRRVVTTPRDGKAAILFDGVASNHKWSGRGTVATLIWSTEGAPADIWGTVDQGERVLGHQPLTDGSRFSVNDYPPGTPGHMHVTDTLDFVIVLAGSIRMDLDDSSVRLKAGDILIQKANNHAWANDGDETCRIAFVLLDGKKKPARG